MCPVCSNVADMVRDVLSGNKEIRHRSACWVLLHILNLPDRVLRQEGLLLLGSQLEVGMHPRGAEGPLQASVHLIALASRRMVAPLACIAHCSQPRAMPTRLA